MPAKKQKKTSADPDRVDQEQQSQPQTEEDPVVKGKQRRFPIVGIGASAGGLEALSDVERSVASPAVRYRHGIHHCDTSGSRAPQHAARSLAKIYQNEGIYSFRQNESRAEPCLCFRS